MSTDVTILDEQIVYEPRVVGQATHAPVLVCGGMGGSALPALALRFLGASSYVAVHRDYGLPERLLPGAHYIAISYSGETEETLSFAREVVSRGYPLSIVSSGGTLLALAQDKGLPSVHIPKGAYEPRDAILSMTKALLALTGETEVLASLATFSDSDAAAREGVLLGAALVGTTPVFYSSTRNELLSYIAKIQANETSKIPAFSNVFPEMNHNELQGFDSTAPGAGALAAPLTAVFMRDGSDSDRVQKRMTITRKLLNDTGVRTLEITLPHETRAQTFLYGWWLLRTAMRTLADQYGVECDATPLIRKLKDLL